MTTVSEDHVVGLKKLLLCLEEKKCLREKIDVVEQKETVKNFFPTFMSLHNFYLQCTDPQKWLLLSLLVIGQGPYVLEPFREEKNFDDALHRLLTFLGEVENFYHSLGGIIGYHLSALQLMLSSKTDLAKEETLYQRPMHYDISEEKEDVNFWVQKGIEHLPKMAEVYLVGGAGDRLGLISENKKSLPAAYLYFGGKTLFEDLVENLQAREFLYFKLFNRQIEVPIVIMTSLEKDNYGYLCQLCESRKYFGRSKQNFFFLMQPQVPVVTEKGHWSLKETLDLSSKPGGHGAFWKLALDNKMFDWLKTKNCESAILRQINNPIGGLNHNLLAFCGLGVEKKKTFGFAACCKDPAYAEGGIALCEEKDGDATYQKVVNVEYTDMRCLQEKDFYPANVNILYFNVHEIEEVAQKNPLPGLLVNMKEKFPVFIGKEQQHFLGGRVESTVQNISDHLVKVLSEEHKEIPTFVMYQKRQKICSPAKRLVNHQNPFKETPLGTYFTYCKNHYELLQKFCNMEMDDLDQEAVLKQKDFSFVHFTYHPALGPLYSIIGQKIQGGKIERGSELWLDIVEIMIKQFSLKGSCVIRAVSPMGSQDETGKLIFDSWAQGRCWLENVTIRNQGVDCSKENIYWKNKIQRKESFHLTLQEGAEFYAKDVHFEGNVVLEVPKNHKMVVTKGASKNLIKIVPIDKHQKPSWHWQYGFGKQGTVDLSIKKRGK